MRYFVLFGLIGLFLFAKTDRTYAFSTRCTAVGNGGDVTITWDRNGLNAADYRAWYIYHAANSAGPFTLIDSTFFFTDTIQTDLSANAYNTSAYYYIRFQTNNGSPSILSDTIRAIGLNVVNPNSGFANLSWSPTRIPLILTNSLYYRIFREYPAGTFTLIDSVNAATSAIPMTYSDLISICDDTIKYKIEVMDQSGCRSVSPIKGDRFRDLQPPSRPVVDSVSVDLAGNVIVSWYVNSSLDTRLYQVLQSIGANWVAIDTVYGRNSTLYNSTINASGGSLSFQVIAKDSCNNPSSQSLSHSTIYLQSSFQLCGKKINLTWSPYNFWGTPPIYEVLVSINGGVESIVGTTSSTTFSDTGLTSGASFCYRVRAREVASTRSSTSNGSCLTPTFPPPPSFSYIRKVTVTGERQVYIEAYVDAAASVSGYQLQRSDSAAGPYTTISTLTISGTSSIGFYDNNVETSTGPYYYRVLTLDSCGLLSRTSNFSRTILAHAVTVDYINTVDWSTYLTWPAGVDRYNIYRSINGSYSAQPSFIVSSSASNKSILDEVINNFYTNGEFCYIVEAIEALGNPYFFVDSARSNEVCVKVQPIIFIANAFHPGGDFNQVWNPSNAFVSSTDYSLRIFDRWGRIAFETHDPLIGWDGTINGNRASVGVYVFQLKSVNTDGGKIERVGSVTLVD